VNRSKYERAQDRIDRGLWTVDAELGVVRNGRGRRIGSLMVNGYIFLTMSPSTGGRSNQNAYAHRVIWESQHGPIPDGLQINHMNGVKTDNRIENLELVTPSGNIQHAVDAGLQVNARGELAHRAKVSQRDVDRIRERAAQGETQQSIADDVGLSRQQISRIVRHERWCAA